MIKDDSLAALAWVLGRTGRKGREEARQRLEAGIAPEPALLEQAHEALALAARSGFTWYPASDPAFPQLLRAIADPPLGLFLKGRWPNGPTAAIVGSRRASAYGKEVASWLGRELARAGVWVVSGMARGVDAAAHRGAVDGGGLTVAVWGAGCDRIYPPEHRDLAQAIAQQGGIITEYPPGTPPRRENFPERNRLIAGLSRVLVVVEADERSGALVSARLALDEGRDVMAVPGSVFSPLSVGPNSLLRAGAAPVVGPQDILDILGISYTSQPRATQEPKDPGLLRFFPRGLALSVDELANRCGKPVPELLPELTALELDGRLVREPDGRFRRS